MVELGERREEWLGVVDGAVRSVEEEGFLGEEEVEGPASKIS